MIQFSIIESFLIDSFGDFAHKEVHNFWTVITHKSHPQNNHESDLILESIPL